MLTPYATVLRVPGALRFSASALLARAPIAMLGIGLVLLVTSVQGSYGVAGGVAAASLVAGSLMAPLQARAADRLGQSRVLWPLMAAHAVALSGTVLAAVSGWPLVTVAVGAALAGATLPQFGAFVRARWTAVLDREDQLTTAFALESVLDEVVFVIGPVLITAVATLVHPAAGLLGTLLLTCGGGALYASARVTEPPVHPRSEHGTQPSLPLLRLLPVIGAFVALGITFGTVEVVTVAFTDILGAPWAAGPVLACFAGGSLVAGLVTGMVSTRAPGARRFVVGASALAIALLPTTVVSTWPALAGVLAVAGLAIAPVLITGFSLLQQESPPQRLTETLAWAGTSLGIGVAVGAALSGRVVDVAGPGTAFAIASGAAGVAAVLAAAMLLPRRAAERAGAR